MYTFSRFITGYRKQQKGWACEDRVMTKEGTDFVVMACADGHGGRKCKDAAKGAALAAWGLCKRLQGLSITAGALGE